LLRCGNLPGGRRGGGPEPSTTVESAAKLIHRGVIIALLAAAPAS